MGAPGIATRNKKLLGATKGIATSNKDAIRAPGIATRNKKLLGGEGVATSNKVAIRGSWHRY